MPGAFLRKFHLPYRDLYEFMVEEYAVEGNGRLVGRLESSNFLTALRPLAFGETYIRALCDSKIVAFRITVLLLCFIFFFVEFFEDKMIFNDENRGKIVIIFVNLDN